MARSPCPDMGIPRIPWGSQVRWLWGRDVSRCRKEVLTIQTLSVKMSANRGIPLEIHRSHGRQGPWKSVQPSPFPAGNTAPEMAQGLTVTRGPEESRREDGSQACVPPMSLQPHPSASLHPPVPIKQRAASVTKSKCILEITVQHFLRPRHHMSCSDSRGPELSATSRASPQGPAQPAQPSQVPTTHTLPWRSVQVPTRTRRLTVPTDSSSGLDTHKEPGQ